jgi:hypothetical protein
MLDNEIQKTDEYIKKIDISVEKVNELQKTLNKNLIKLSKLNPSLAEKLIKPIVQSFEPIQSKLPDIKLVFPVLLSLVIVFISMLFSNIVTLREINSDSYFRNLITPMDDIIFTVGLIVTNLIVVQIQVIVLLCVAQLKFNIDILSNFSQIFLICLLFSIIFVFLGMIFAYIFDNEQTSILVTTFSAISIYLFSNVITPLETMPILAAKLASLNPFVISQKIFKEFIIFQIPLEFLVNDIINLIIYLNVSFVLLVIISKYKNLKKI